MKPAKDAVIFIDRAELLGDFKICLTFNDSTQKTVDFGPFLRASRNPLIQAYLNPVAFARFTVRDGDLIWDDYELCFPIADLYEGHV